MVMHLRINVYSEPDSYVYICQVALNTDSLYVNLIEQGTLWVQKQEFGSSRGRVKQETKLFSN